MAGFVRRFSSFPPVDVLTAIEGINVVDLPPPGSIQGVDQGVVALVGEFADVTYGASVDSAGAFSTDPRPVEVFSAQDMVEKVGGFDSTLGQFGGDMGSGFVEVRNKKFGRLILVPINVASSAGFRLWRELPTNKSAVDPTPVVPVAAAVVEAGREFRQSAVAAERAKVASRVAFTASDAIATGTDGSVTSAAAAATQTFSSATGDFVEDGVQVGDILVTGVVGASGGQGDDAGTWRITVVAATTLTVQRLDAANFAWTTTFAALAYRVHPASDADSGGNSVMATQAAYTVAARPLTNGAGTGSSATDGTWATGTLITPVTAPAAITATTADPLSGLTGAVGPTTAVAYTASVQRANAVNAATIDALYVLALDALKADEIPAAEVNHVWAARKSQAIRTALRAHALDASSVGLGRTVAVSPELDLTLSTQIATVTGTADPGVGANRDERFWYSWPPVRTFVPEAVGHALATADGRTTTDGVLDVTFDGFLSSLIANLAPERNPGEASTTTRGVLAPVIGLARNTPTLDVNAYKLLRLRGIAGVRMDRTVGPVLQSGVTTSLVSGLKNINRRRMADYIEDSIAQSLKPFAKLPLSNQFKDGVVGQIDDFLAQLLSADNPVAQRISSYLIDDDSGNTPTLEAQGIFVVIVKVRTLATADFITIQAEVGENVVTTRELQAA